MATINLHRPTGGRRSTEEWLENIPGLVHLFSGSSGWGTRIPVWTCQECDRSIVKVEGTQMDVPGAAVEQLVQDPELLDTHFSPGSGLLGLRVARGEQIWTPSTPATPGDGPGDPLLLGLQE